MAEPLALTIHIDGGSRGNPGPAAFGYVITAPGKPRLLGNGTLGRATNNVAEYTGLVSALTKAAELGATDVRIRSDSELLVRQMRGEYRVKNEGLAPLYEQARDLVGRIGSVTFEHVPRENNTEADRLCNEALDGQVIGMPNWDVATANAALATTDIQEGPPPRFMPENKRPEQSTVKLPRAVGPVLEGKVVVQGTLKHAASSGFHVLVLGHTFAVEFGDLRRFADTQPDPEAAAARGSVVRIEGKFKTIGSVERPEGVRLIVDTYLPLKRR
ncbi:MAG TPA: ribonuclease HI family protein [Gemmatales bacterium]|nr:ribonuclease HI family protein [Gemmatales bacterium]